MKAWSKQKMSNNNVKRARIKLSIPFENFQIAPLEIEILLPELSQNHEIILQEIGRNLLKNSPILNFKTLFSIYIQNATSFVSDKKS
jgi:hypothetical protein